MVERVLAARSVTTIALARPPSRSAMLSRKSSTISLALCLIDVGCRTASLTSSALAFRSSTSGLADARRLLLDRGVPQPPLGVVGDVVGEHVEDVALLDRLPHRVHVERHVHAPLAGLRGLTRPGRSRPNSFSVARLRRRGEREVRQVRLRPAHPRQVLLVRLVVLGGNCAFAPSACLEPRRRVAALRRVRLVDDHRVPLVRRDPRR